MDRSYADFLLSGFEIHLDTFFCSKFWTKVCVLIASSKFSSICCCFFGLSVVVLLAYFSIFFVIPVFMKKKIIVCRVPWFSYSTNSCWSRLKNLLYLFSSKRKCWSFVKGAEFLEVISPCKCGSCEVQGKGTDTWKDKTQLGWCITGAFHPIVMLKL